MGVVGINKRDENIREVVTQVHRGRDELVLGEKIISNQGEKINILDEIGELGLQ